MYANCHLVSDQSSSKNTKAHLSTNTRSYLAVNIARSESLSWIGRRPDLVANSNSFPCFALVKRWLDDCRQNHPLCQAHHNHQSTLPKRLIDIRVSGRPRLCEASTISMVDTSYATLSHCWGNPDTQRFCVTRAQTLHERLESIPWKEIPETFRHAIDVTRALGLGFLWIDSLCIVQDDLQDWAQESAKMSRIYANAVVTIAASAAENAAQGFLCHRPYQDTAFGTNSAMRIRRDLHHSGGAITGSVVLNTRGWVFQERLLSRRILHFEREEVIWECRTVRMCECGSERPPLSSQNASLGTAYTFLYDTKSVSETCDWWRNVVVEEYSALDLTKSSDKLPALSGLATLVREKTKGVYLAGLWLSDIASGLLWELWEGVPHQHRQYSESDIHYVVPWNVESQDFNTPSWSWARTTGRLRHERLPLTDIFVEVNHHHIQLATVDHTGAVSSGVLDLTCPVFRETNDGLTDLRRFSEDRDDRDFFLVGPWGYQIRIRCWLDDATKVFKPTSALALIGARRDRLDSVFNTVQLRGIIIDSTCQPLHPDGHVRKFYQRIGYWKAKFNEKVDSPYNETLLKKYMTNILLR
jgi:hypothetical protein